MLLQMPFVRQTGGIRQPLDAGGAEHHSKIPKLVWVTASGQEKPVPPMAENPAFAATVTIRLQFVCH